MIDLDSRITAGEVFGFLGPNGAGKSTTIRLLLGLYRADAGTVRVFGHDPWRESVHIHERVGYLPGEFALYPRLTGRRHLEAAARVRGLSDLSYRDELADRFGAELDTPVHTLSKGNRQKIGLVLAFMHRPQLLILDEPTSGLDPLLRQEFIDLIRETVADGRTVLLSSHELDEVQRFVDRVAIIKDGRLVVTDTVEHLRASAPRTVELRFDRDIDTAALDELDQVEVVARGHGAVTLAVSGPIAPLLRVAADLKPVDMTVRGADLDELCLNFYRTGADREVTDVH
ncbi:ABC transporter ATP-binding protein [Rhodococcus opacus]|uniref:ABC transporter ATP-binding protein n=1 Tax=Rhodococcus opacus TaxID=37919 RepID=UPI0002A45332|nr:ABC transporter ATP-binding protein [Rhodococcus opacus]ELB87263.1 ABC transporter ATP-binding protein [Rhodococcus wratislaviensis IFP 2016]MDX5970049.1 ABC transporter ATP-binding protein [Rhodococcus opacus]CAG7634390.1 Vitamin B12 import ATP-binding protein BtuD [Rhodococcus opacus]